MTCQARCPSHVVSPPKAYFGSKPPLPPEDVLGYERLARLSEIAIARDLIWNRRQALELLMRRAVDVVQPDVARAGGLTGCTRIAELVDVFGASCTPHVSVEGPVGVPRLAADQQPAPPPARAPRLHLPGSQIRRETARASWSSACTSGRRPGTARPYSAPRRSRRT